jgi:OmpA-OmpF porin, OOP family
VHGKSTPGAVIRSARMPRRIASTVSSIPLALVLAAAPARAVECTDVANPCINDDVLWPHAGPALFVGVGSARTVSAGRIGFSLITSYLSRPVVLDVATPGLSQQTKLSAVSNQVNGTFLWAYGMTNRLELDLALPVTFGQNGTGLAPVTGGPGLRSTAVRDMRFGFAYTVASNLRLGGDEPSGSAAANGWRLAVRLEMSAPTGDPEQFAGERSGVIAPGISGEFRQNAFFAGAEVGERVRPITTFLGVGIGPQIVSALGVGYDLLPRQLLSTELEAWAFPTFDAQGTVSVVPAEWQLSARTAPVRGGALSIQLGGGGGIPFGGDLPLTTPRFRFTLGVRWDGGLESRPESLDSHPENK